MNCRVLRAALAFVLLIVSILPSSPATACGPYFPSSVFIQRQHPDLPLKNFAAGHLGILQHSYPRSYLVVAYRYLAGGSFDASEQQQLVALWAHRLDREGEWLTKRDAYQHWREARYRYGTGEKPEPPKDRQNSTPGYMFLPKHYDVFENCTDDAYLTATKTLQARSKQFGQHSEEVRSWLAAQDAVFDNCGGASGTNAFPTEAPQQFPALLRADRTYQIAAAYFYNQNWDQAEQRFRAIAQDSSSPWRAVAAVVALRTRLRRMTLSDDVDLSAPSSQKELAAIDAELRNLEKLPAMRDFSAALWRMRGFVEFRLNPAARRLELAHTIEHATDRVTLREDLDDFTKLLDQAVGEDPDGDPDDAPKRAGASYNSTKSLRASSPLTDWVLTFQADSQAAAGHALAKWNETHSVPWLVAALDKATPTTPGVAALLQAGVAVQPNSAAYLTIAFHVARLQAQAGNHADAMRTIENALPSANLALEPSAANLLAALRMKLARNLDEFLQFAPRRGTVSTDRDGRDLPDPEYWCRYGNAQYQAECLARRSPPPMFDSDAATILTEGTPTRLLASAAANSSLPTNLRLRIAEAAWVRSVLLKDEAASLQLVPILSSLAPELAAGLKAYTDAAPSSRPFAAAFFILHHPELHPYVSAGIGRETPPGRMDLYRDNWWCSFAAPANDDDTWGDYYSMYTHISGPLLSLYPEQKLYYPDFLTDAETKAAQAEWAELSKLDGAPNWLAAQVLAFAKSNPNDPRVPEALHFVVRATHLGCADTAAQRYGKAAFQTLHRRYPRDPWTQKTPYWY